MDVSRDNEDSQPNDMQVGGALVSEAIKTPPSEVQLLRWENELLKRERALLQREKCSSCGGNSSEIDQPTPLRERNPMKIGLREVETLIREFNPSQQNMTAKNWIESINSLKTLYEWDDRTTLFYATLRLGGAARDWYQARRDVIRTYEEFQGQLYQSFPVGQDDASTLLNIMERKRLPNETIEEYAYSVAALAKGINLTEKSIIRYITGLQNQNLINVLMASNCDTIPELLRAVKEFEEVLKQNQTRNLITHVNEPSTSKPTWKHPANRQFHRNRSDPYSYRNNSGIRPRDRIKGEFKENENTGKARNVTCFKCKNPGHYARDCNLRNLRCFRCQQGGHTSKECKTRQVLSTAKDSSLEERDEYHKVVQVEGVPVLAYFDLGSECTTIKEDIVRANNWLMEGSKLKLIGFGNQKTDVVGKINQQVKVGDINFPVEIMVVKGDAQNVPMIVGRNYVDRPEIEIVKSWKRFDIIQRQPQAKEQLTKKGILTSHINIAEEAGEAPSVMLISLIEEYRDCFAQEMNELGKTDLIEMNITLKEQRIIRYQPYRVPYGLKSVLKNKIDELLQLGVIQPSSSEYASPVLLVKKKNDEYRMCVDYRKVNAITLRETFPMPNIEETLNMLAHKRIFTTLDLLSGYHQVPVADSSRHLTAFVTPEGQYEYLRVPFGLTNAPAVFMRLMAKVIRNIERGKIIVFMDDILIPSVTIEENIETLKQLLDEIRKAGLTINIRKCEFFKRQLQFLGHEISENGITPSSGKTSAIETYKRPENAKEVKQFLGLAGYFRRFVQGFSLIARPLHNLLKKDVPFNWTEEAEMSFQKLRELLSKRPVLALYDEKAEHEVHTDASSHGIAGILMQKNGGELRPVSYYSRATTPCETKYHSYELEALAVVESLERFKHYLLHRKFKVVTDCNSLRQTQAKKDLVPRIARWWLKISEYDFELEFRPAGKLVHADALSRNPSLPAKEPTDITGMMLAIGTADEDWLATLQKDDPEIVEIRKILNGDILKSEKKYGIKGNFTLENQRVFKKTAAGNRFYVPKGARWRVIQAAHDDRGHPGVDRTLETLRKYVWFPHMKPTVKKYLAACMDCLYNKRGNDETNYQLHAPERRAIPFDTVHIDHLGPFPKSKSGNSYLVGVVDSFSKLVILRAVKTTNSRSVIRLLDDTSQFLGIPHKIITDRGTAFTSREFDNYCAENSIKHIGTTVKTPRSNGQIERYFRTIKNSIASMTKDIEGRDWDQNIKAIQWALNTLKNSTTKITPQKLVLTYEPRDILKNKLLLALHHIIEEDEEENLPLSELKERALARITEEQQRQMQNFNATHKGPRKYEEGDLVLIRHEPPATGQSRKTQPRYKGPYRVKAVLGKDRYVITDTDEYQVSRKPYESAQAAERMKPWCRLEDLDFDGGPASDTDSD